MENLATLYEALTGRICLRELPPSKLVFSTEFDSRPGYTMVRNVYSVLVGLLLLLAASPVLALAAVMMKRSSPGPFFERETRVGIKGIPIQLYRFRNRDSLKWLRRFKLLDLPLLLNVVRGDLALFGPAPEYPEFLAALRKWIPLYNHRLSVKPGLTGWEQIHRNSAALPDTLEALEYDFYYIKHLSPQLDAYIAILSLRSALSPHKTGTT